MEPVLNTIRMTAKSEMDSVRLRWAPTNYPLWRKLIDAGLYLERHTVVRDGEVVALAERSRPIRLNVVPLGPAPEARFGELAADNRYVAIGGQAIYGERFDAGAGSVEAGQFGSILNRAKEDQNRFGFGLFSADQSWVAATMMGLAFTDRTVRRNEVYLYRLRPVLPIKGLDTLAGTFVSVVVNNNAPEPPVQDLRVEFGDRTATLSWEKVTAATFYSGYYLLRSPDGINYTKVNPDGLPFVPLQNDSGDGRAYLRDSLPENDRPYFYAVQGVTPFGTLGEMSPAVEGSGKGPAPDQAPSLASILPLEEGFQIGWTFTEEFPAVRFRVERAAQDEGPYVDISGQLPSEQRSFVDHAPLMANYYRVIVTDRYGREKISFSALAQPNDTEPPAVPNGLRGLILTDGRVVLNWEANTERDLLGYRIFLSNQPNVEYSLATGAPIERTHFVGTTTLATLSPKLYARIVSLDLRHNTSEMSETVELLRPDTIPPTKPLFKDLRADEDGIQLNWAFSMSPDVEMQELQRRPHGEDGTWETLSTYAAPLVSERGAYTDEGLERGKKYDYRVLATDFAGLTASSRVFTGNAIDNFIRRGISEVKATPDRRAFDIDLRWRYVAETEAFSHFEIYRGTGDDVPVSIGVIKPNVALLNGRTPRYGYTDKGPLRMNTRYVYRLRAVYENGAASPLSPPVEVAF